MIYFYFTDPHIGVSRANSSAKRLARHVYDKTFDLAYQAYEAGKRVMCLGDLFHRHSNKEEVVLQGLSIAQCCTKVLAGNHDCLNIANSEGSLSVVAAAAPDVVVMNPNLSEPYCEAMYAEDGCLMVFVPHALTQELFVQSLQMAIDSAHSTSEFQVEYKILHLHCNVGEAFGKVEAEGSTLALTDELQDLVAQHFDLVMVGHDHHPRIIEKGNCSIVVMGNVYPVSFGEIEDRFVYEFDTETRNLTMLDIFTADEAFEAVSSDLLLETAGDLTSTCQLVEVQGSVKPEQYPALVRAVQKFSKVNEATLLSLRNVTEIDRPNAAEQKAPGYVRKTIPELVEAALKGTSLWATYEELQNETV